MIVIAKPAACNIRVNKNRGKFKCYVADHQYGAVKDILLNTTTKTCERKEKRSNIGYKSIDYTIIMKQQIKCRGNSINNAANNHALEAAKTMYQNIGK